MSPGTRDQKAWVLETDTCSLWVQYASNFLHKREMAQHWRNHKQKHFWLIQDRFLLLVCCAHSSSRFIEMFVTVKQEISHALLRAGNYKLMKATQTSSNREKCSHPLVWQARLIRFFPMLWSKYLDFFFSVLYFFPTESKIPHYPTSWKL